LAVFRCLNKKALFTHYLHHSKKARPRKLQRTIGIVHNKRRGVNGKRPGGLGMAARAPPVPAGVIVDLERIENLQHRNGK